MGPSNRQADYDQIAHTFNRRYERNEYAGVARALQEFIGDNHGLHILEVGCGTGHWLKVLQEPERFLAGLDFSAGMLARAQERLPSMALIRGRAERLSLPAEFFDRVFCINAIHHFTDKLAFLKEVRRILRPGGMILTVGLDPHSGLDQWHVYDYFPESLVIDKQRYLSSENLRDLMSTAGFEDCVTQEVEHWIIRVPAREALAQGRLDPAATSQLSVLTKEEYQRGLQRIYHDIERAEEKGQTLFLTADLRLYGTTGAAG